MPSKSKEALRKKMRSRATKNSGTYDALMREYKRDGCALCGYNKCSSALEFHHIGDKSFEIGKARQAGWGRTRIVAEISKCIVVCANCHREIHANQIRGDISRIGDGNQINLFQA